LVVTKFYGAPAGCGARLTLAIAGRRDCDRRLRRRGDVALDRRWRAATALWRVGSKRL